MPAEWVEILKSMLYEETRVCSQKPLFHIDGIFLAAVEFLKPTKLGLQGLQRTTLFISSLPFESAQKGSEKAHLGFMLLRGFTVYIFRAIKMGRNPQCTVP